MATRINNEFDSDGATDLPPVNTLPVMRLLQPMLDGGGDTELDFTDASCTIAAAVAAGDSRAPRGRMALLEKSLSDENEVRASLLREEHAVRFQMMQEEHQRGKSI
ncbi:uncharacterized protein LOC144105177 [Amblyomma americanum]